MSFFSVLIPTVFLFSSIFLLQNSNEDYSIFGQLNTPYVKPQNNGFQNNGYQNTDYSATEEKNEKQKNRISDFTIFSDRDCSRDQIRTSDFKAEKHGFRHDLQDIDNSSLYVSASSNSHNHSHSSNNSRSSGLSDDSVTERGRGRGMGR